VKRRRTTARQLLGDSLFGLRVTQHALARWVERASSRLLRRLVKRQLKRPESDALEALCESFSLARFVGRHRSRSSWYFVDAGITFVVIPHTDPADREATWLVVSCVPRRKRDRHEVPRMEPITLGNRRRLWRAHRLQILERDAQRELREAG
jgi:hypothetical protein